MSEKGIIIDNEYNKIIFTYNKIVSLSVCVCVYVCPEDCGATTARTAVRLVPEER